MILSISSKLIWNNYFMRQVMDRDSVYFFKSLLPFITFVNCERAYFAEVFFHNFRSYFHVVPAQLCGITKTKKKSAKIVRSEPPEVFCEKFVLQSFVKFKGKHSGLQLYYKRDPSTGVFLCIFRNFEEQLFYRTLLDDCL